MRTLLATLVICTALIGCTSTPTVHTDVDPTAAFASYRTYSWIQPPAGASPLQGQRIAEAINAELAARGWQQVNANADVAIAANVATETRQDIDTFYNGPAYAGWGWHGPWAMGSVNTSVRNYQVGTLVVDLFDTKTRQAVWRGTAEGTVPSSPDKVAEAARVGISKMFEALPSGK